MTDSRPPAKALQIDPTGRGEPDPLGFEEGPLPRYGVGGGSRADRPLCVDDPVPRHRVLRVPERVADQARLPRHSRHLRHLAIRGHAASGDPADGGEDPGMGRG